MKLLLTVLALSVIALNAQASTYSINAVKEYNEAHGITAPEEIETPYNQSELEETNPLYLITSDLHRCVGICI